MMNSLSVARVAVIVSLLAPSAAAIAQESSFGAVIAGTRVPLTIQATDLTNEYHAIKISTAAAGDPLAATAPTMGAGMGGANGPNRDLMKILDLSWTTGAIIATEGHRFLVTYKLDMSAADFLARSTPQVPPAETASAGPGAASPAPATLKLTLVRVDAIQTIEANPGLTKEELLRILGQGKGRTPGDAAGDIADRTATVSNMKQAALGLMLYSTDYDDVLPYVQGTKAAQYVTYPYVKTIKIWQTKNPKGGEVRFNIAIAGVNTTQIEDPAKTVLLYESAAWPDGKRAVAFADGHVSVVDETVWASLQKWLVRRYRATGRPLPISYGMDWNPGDR